MSFSSRLNLLSRSLPRAYYPLPRKLHISAPRLVQSEKHVLDKNHGLDSQSAEKETAREVKSKDAADESSSSSSSSSYASAREASTSSTSKEKLGWQPGQGGEQVGGLEGGHNKTTGSKEASGGGSLLDKAKDALGFGGQKRSFTSGVMVRKSEEKGAPRGDPTLSPKHGNFQGDRHQPSYPQDPSISQHATSTTPPSATYTHIKGTPSPSAHKVNYEPATGTPSGRAAQSSTSTDPLNEGTTRDHPHYVEGVGSSSKVLSADGGWKL